ncbi:MAG: sel1 repeat family protein [Micavibrio sp.]|nr:MAG: sel1 repeat family protein [Micavibrio sp.]
MKKKIIIPSAILFVAIACFALLPQQKSSSSDVVEDFMHKVITTAKQGDAAAQTLLGAMYLDGRGGMAQDDEKAVKWWRKAAGQGYTLAQYYLGWMHDEGRGVIQDDVEAYFWCYLAAESEHETGHKRAAELRDIIAKRLSQKELMDAQKRAREWQPREWQPKTAGETIAD